MTIKKNLIILTSFIVLIPVLCFISTAFLVYYRSPARFLSWGTNQLKRIESNGLSQKDIDQFEKSLNVFPQDFELCLFDNDTIYFSTIPYFSTAISINKQKAMDYIDRTSSDYYYQFSRIKTPKGMLFILSRMPKNTQNPNKVWESICKTLLFILPLIVLSIFCIIKLFKTITKSIQKINNSTKQLVDGNLSIQITNLESEQSTNEITSILNSLEKMRLALILEDQRKKYYLMGISHDLRTPVAIIKGYSEAILDGVIYEQEEIKKTINLILGRTSQMGGLIDTLINFTKINDNEFRETLIPTSLTNIIKEFEYYAEHTSNVFQRNFIANIDLPEEDIVIPLNEQLVKRSFENLFSNAVKYTKQNDTIELNAYIQSDNLFIEFKDNGIGISEEDQKYIFDFFYRGTNSRHKEGMGMGLTVVKNIIDTHKWKINVSSKINTGTSFIITVPLTAK